MRFVVGSIMMIIGLILIVDYKDVINRISAKITGDDTRKPVRGVYRVMAVGLVFFGFVILLGIG
ncbi:hypothetical protein ACHZ98_34185 [Streptomyces sp. MAR4 CNY-716]